MIHLTAKDVAEFRELYRRETGESITDDEARAYALRLIQFVGLVLKSDGRHDMPPAAGRPTPRK